MPNQPIPARGGAAKSRLEIARFAQAPHDSPKLSEAEHAALAAHHSKQSKNIRLPLATRDWHTRRAVWHHAHSGDHQGDIEAPDPRTGFKDAPAGGAKLADDEMDALNQRRALKDRGYKYVASVGEHVVYHHPDTGHTAVHHYKEGYTSIHHHDRPVPDDSVAGTHDGLQHVLSRIHDKKKGG